MQQNTPYRFVLLLCRCFCARPRTGWHAGSILELNCFIHEALWSVTITNPQGHYALWFAGVNISSLGCCPSTCRSLWWCLLLSIMQVCRSFIAYYIGLSLPFRVTLCSILRQLIPCPSFFNLTNLQNLGTRLTKQNDIHNKVNSILNTRNACYPSIQNLSFLCLLSNN